MKRTSTALITRHIGHTLNAWMRRNLEQRLGGEDYQLLKDARIADKLPENATSAEVRIKLPEPEQRLSAFDGQTGGAVVPYGWLLEQVSGERDNANVFRRLATRVPVPDTTTGGQAFIANISGEATREGEGKTATETDIATGRWVFNFDTYKTGMRKIPSELVQDGGSALEQGLTVAFINELYRAERRYITYVLATSDKVPSVSAGASGSITLEDCLNAIASLGEKFADNPNIGIVMHPTVASALRRAKDGNGRYLSDPNLSYSRVAGMQLFLNSAMPSSLESGTVSAYIGDFNAGLAIADTGSITIKQYVERFAESDEVGMRGILRSAVAVTNAGDSPLVKLVH